MSLYTIILFAFCIALMVIINYIRRKSIKCPECQSRGFSKRTNKISLGVNFRINQIQKYRIYYKCNKCEFQWSEIEEFDESGSS
jgi:DNA-directed RNA polymerase subunit RPC12/RpoP